MTAPPEPSPTGMAAPLTRSKGMRDLFPADMRAFRAAEDAFRTAAGRWGYAEIRTPTIENYSLFTSVGALTPQMLSRVYSFLDWDGWSGERVVLRPDSTVPVVRAAHEAGLPLPARLFYVQNVFRFSPDEDREDWQFGVEYLGAPAITGDAEVALVAADTLAALDLAVGSAVTLRLSHAGILHAIANAVANGSGEPGAWLDVVAESGAGPLFEQARRQATLQPFIDAIETGAGGVALLRNLSALAAGLPAAGQPLAELEQIATALGTAGVTVTIDPSLVLDFEYYTGAVFQFSAGESVLASGGRYAPPLAGEPESACGLALDVNAIGAQLVTRAAGTRVVALIPAAPSDIPEALRIARTLHGYGLSAAPAPTGPLPRVSINAGSLLLETEDGTHTPAGIDDLVARLLQYK